MFKKLRSWIIRKLGGYTNLVIVTHHQTRGTGEWLTTDAYPHHVFCSRCYKTYVTNEEIIEGRGDKRTYCTEAEFCPHCGAEMINSKEQERK